MKKAETNSRLALGGVDPTGLPTSARGGVVVSGPRVIQRPSSLTEAVVDQLRSLIFAGTLSPGAVLRQQDLAGHLGVSRTPLREAFRLLEQEGLLETSVSGASRVVDLAGAAAKETLDLREVIDGLVARLSAERGLSGPERRRLERSLTAMERANESDDKKAYMMANTDFHMRLLSGLNHRWLDQFSTLVRMSCQATYLQLQHQTDRLRQSADEHRGILRAILDQNSLRAEELARNHIRNARQHWVASEEETPVPSPTRRGRDEIGSD